MLNETGPPVALVQPAAQHRTSEYHTDRWVFAILSCIDGTQQATASIHAPRSRFISCRMTGRPWVSSARDG